VLAAEMALAARGEEVVACWEAMVQSQGAAAAIFAGARAMTDVTGFGLAGHLLAVAEASGVGVRVALGSVPLLPGALRLAETGVRSTLFAENRALAHRLRVPAGARGDLLFDPQT